jgi:hypothetical protein
VAARPAAALQLDEPGGGGARGVPCFGTSCPMPWWRR